MANVMKYFKRKKLNLKIVDKKSVFVDDTVVIGKNVTIYPNNIIKGNTVIKDNAVILPQNYIVDSVIGEGVNIEYSNVESSEIGSGTHVGPYARLRPNTVIGENCKIGNFVEIKNSKLGSGTKASHLAYIGDAEIGKDCNIGCGAIFVNYNGKSKNRSVVGDKCFIGSNVNVIAPVNIADGSYICAGTTITIDTEPKDFVIGRARETIKHNYSDKYGKEM